MWNIHTKRFNYFFSNFFLLKQTLCELNVDKNGPEENLGTSNLVTTNGQDNVYPKVNNDFNLFTQVWFFTHPMLLEQKNNCGKFKAWFIELYFLSCSPITSKLLHFSRIWSENQWNNFPQLHRIRCLID